MARKVDKLTFDVIMSASSACDASGLEVANALRAAGFRVRSVTLLDTETGLTGSYRDARADW